MEQNKQQHLLRLMETTVYPVSLSGTKGSLKSGRQQTL